jgi:hypothetical protein
VEIWPTFLRSQPFDQVSVEVRHPPPLVVCMGVADEHVMFETGTYAMRAFGMITLILR